ncbi:MAG: hypothetical protein JWR38_1311 [Mucilaginibacter sp.]|nr:hypothetical protein [Mucilaginibacter sp.]
MNIFFKRPNVDGVLYKMLKQLGMPVLFSTIKEELYTHPDYPSLLAVNDVLMRFGVSSQTFRISIEHLKDLPLPFIAISSKQGSEFVLITKLSANFLAIDNGNMGPRKISWDNFKAIFTGIVLAVDAASSKHPDHSLQQKISALTGRLRYPVALTFLGLILLIYIKSHAPYWIDHLLHIGLIVLVKTSGLLITILLLVQSINNNNPLIQKLCGGANTDCNAILGSKAARLFEWLTWSEIGFFYFAGTWLTILSGNTSIATMQILAWFNIISLPYTVYSIYYQGWIAKQWCVLCCTVQALLWLEFFPLLTNLWQPLVSPDSGQIKSLLVSLLLPVTIWILLKPLLLELQKIKPVQYQLRKFKYNIHIFRNLMKEQPRYALPDEDYSIILGNLEAENIITMVSNPYCQPCSKTHQQLNEWLSNGRDLQIRVVFISDNETKDRKKIIHHLIALNELKDKTLIQLALHDWYSQEQKDYESWAKAYPASLDDVYQQKMDKQKEWCEIAEITATPTLLFNGRRLPENYKLQDIKYMLS